jgi:hypothetical protein
MESMSHRPAWKTLLAFAIIYFVGGSTFLAIRVGVREVPPLLLAGEELGMRTILGTAFVLVSVVLITTTRASRPAGASEAKGAT